MKSTIKNWIDLYYKNLSAGGKIELPVLSGSMIPQLVPGKKVGIKPYSNEKLKTGDIIVFKYHKKLYAHRIIIIFSFFNKKFIYQKGDNNLYGSWIKDSDIIGIVDFSINQDDKILDFSNQEMQKTAKIIATKQLIKNIVNITLFIPRKVKRLSKKILKIYLLF